MQYGLLGGKLGHSLSPAIHAAFFKRTGLTGSYQLLETAASDLPERMDWIKNNLQGCNVTIPHKIAVMDYLDAIALEATAIGAVNTIAIAGGITKGYNTDYFGFGRMLEYNSIAVSGKTAVVLGSGGAARAVVKYLADQKADKIYLASRNPNTIDPHFYEMAGQCVAISYEDLPQITGSVIINCTPVGMFPRVEASPVNAAVNAQFDAAVDLIYNPAQTLFLKQAQSAGKLAVNGLFMLVAQAVAAQEIWQGQSYDSGLIVQIMADVEQCL